MKSSIVLFLLFIFCSCEQQNKDKISIAILTPITHPSLEQIEKGFIKTMEEANPGKYVFTTYNAQGNKTLMHSEIEEITHQQYALIFTIGTTASQMTVENVAKKNIQIPIVFSSVNDPVGFHIVKSEESSGSMVTGVKELLNFREEIAAMRKYVPNLKNVLLVYNPAEPGMEKDKKEVELILAENNINLTSIEIFQTNELLTKVSPFIVQADALLVLKDNIVVAGMDTLVKLCNKNQVPIMASDLDSSVKGATFAFGIYETEFGVEGAKKALQILHNGTHPSDIPVTAPSNFVLLVNADAAQKQGVDLSLTYQTRD